MKLWGGSVSTRNPNENWEKEWDTIKGGQSPARRTVPTKRQNETGTRRVQINKNVPNDDWELDWEEIWEKDKKHSQAGSSVPHKAKSIAKTAVKTAAAPAKTIHMPTQTKKKKKKKHPRLKSLFVSAVTLAALYWVIAFSNIPVIAKWRAIYIETAMGTMTHQWLATAFFPRSVIDAVMNGRGNLDEAQNGLFSNWEISNLPGAGLSLPWESAQDQFFRIYSEIDQKSFEEYTKQHKDSILNKDHYLVIDKAGLDDGGTTIKTTHGDEVLAIDTVNGITIVKVTGEGFVGRLAIIKDPSRVGIGLAKSFGSAGSTIREIAENHDAVLGMNASGFYDPGGHGNGGGAYGLVVSGGKTYSKMVGKNDKVIAFDHQNKLNIGKYKSAKNFRDGVEFKPALVINGEKTVNGSSGWGIQPRSAIGQNKDGEVLMLVVDGRQPGYSIGCTVGDCADIMLKYGAMQACNLDGGSSSILYYNGREISKPSSANKQLGRHIPDGFLVYKK